MSRIGIHVCSLVTTAIDIMYRQWLLESWSIRSIDVHRHRTLWCAIDIVAAEHTGGHTFGYSHFNRAIHIGFNSIIATTGQSSQTTTIEVASNDGTAG